MEYTFFQEQIGNLIDVFGSKNYPALRVKFFWETFSHVNADVFKNAVKKLCVESGRAPLKNELLEAVTCFSSRNELKRIECTSCGGNGLVYRMIGMYQNAFRCACPNGEIPGKAIPHISTFNSLKIS